MCSTQILTLISPIAKTVSINSGTDSVAPKWGHLCVRSASTLHSPATASKPPDWAQWAKFYVLFHHPGNPHSYNDTSSHSFHQSIGAEWNGLFCRSTLKPISVISAPRPPALRFAHFFDSSSGSAPLTQTHWYSIMARSGNVVTHWMKLKSYASSWILGHKVHFFTNTPGFVTLDYDCIPDLFGVTRHRCGRSSWGDSCTYSTLHIDTYQSIRHMPNAVYTLL